MKDPTQFMDRFIRYQRRTGAYDPYALYLLRRIRYQIRRSLGLRASMTYGG